LEVNQEQQSKREDEPNAAEDRASSRQTISRVSRRRDLSLRKPPENQREDRTYQRERHKPQNSENQAGDCRCICMGIADWLLHPRPTIRAVFSLERIQLRSGGDPG
jgi:hypothetical protein